MRYRGQGHEISVQLPSRPFAADDVTMLQELFDTSYAAHFTRIIPNLNVEILTWTLTLATERALPQSGATVGESVAPTGSETRAMFDPASGTNVEAKLVRRDTLAPGHCLDGPAILTEDETSTVVPPNYRVMINALGEIELLRKGS